MNKLFKALIVWLMLAAIPFQGFAAASMLACAPVQTQSSIHAHMNMAPEHCATMGATQSHAASDTDHSSTHHQAGGKCSTCASCCCVAALAPPAPLTRAPNETSASLAFRFDDSAAARVDLALPERPPKNFADLT